MRKVYRKLSEEQKQRGVIFSSQLMPNGSIHEVTRENVNEVSEFARNKGLNKISLLLDDKFFNGSDYKYNIIRK